MSPRTSRPPAAPGALAFADQLLLETSARAEGAE